MTINQLKECQGWRMSRGAKFKRLVRCRMSFLAVLLKRAPWRVEGFCSEDCRNRYREKYKLPALAPFRDKPKQASLL